MVKQYHVYMMASFNQVLYIGVTNDLQKRVYQHKNKTHPDSFTARYQVNRLVYFETFGDVQEAIAREKQLKSWRREKKIALLQSHNPTWKDLSSEWE